MDDLKGIPEKDFETLCEIMGHDEALKFIKDVEYNYKAVAGKILIFNIKTFNKRRPVLFWSIVTILILLIAYSIFDTLYY